MGVASLVELSDEARIVAAATAICTTFNRGFQIERVAPYPDVTGGYAIFVRVPDDGPDAGIEVAPRLARLLEEIPGVARVYLTVASVD